MEVFNKANEPGITTEATFRQGLPTFFLNGKKAASDDLAALTPLALRAFQSAEDIDLSGQMALALLQEQLQPTVDQQTAFLSRIKKNKSELEGLLRLEEAATDPMMDHLDFAADLMSFDKIRAVAIDTVSSHLPAARIRRIKWAVNTLAKAQTAYAEGNITFLASSHLTEQLELAGILKIGKLISVPVQKVCVQARAESSEAIQTFIQTVGALRMGDLMLSQSYDEQLHDAYFDTFDLSRLSEDDLGFLPVTIVLTEAKALMGQANDFLALLSQNSFVKVLALNWLDDLYQLDEKEELEIASLAVFRRNSFVYQGALDRADDCAAAIRKGLDFSGAVFWNLLATTSEDAEEDSLSEMKIAVESRYFPRLEYQARGNHFDFQQLKLHQNASPEKNWQSLDLSKDATGESAVYPIFSLTPASFLAIRADLRAQLLRVPKDYSGEELIPLGLYLTLPTNEVRGKYPFIWLSTREEGEIYRAVVPFSWLSLCRNRYEYWCFLQSIAGINHTHRETSIREAKASWEMAKELEVKALKEKLEAQFEVEKAKILQNGITKMLYGFIYEDNLEELLKEVKLTVPTPEPVIRSEAVESLPEKQEAAAESVIIQETQAEAWVESEDCTSCKDCVVAVPGVFKYNEDNQAYVYDPKGGTFAQIVAVAEKCPARCIHPGRPLNPNEPGLEKWIKRSQKFD